MKVPRIGIRPLVLHGITALIAVLATLAICAFLQDETCNKDLRHIHPELACNKKYVIEKHEYIAVQEKIESYLARETESNRITRAAVYFRDLENGPIMSINSSAEFVPASLLKLPVFIAYLKEAENNPELLEEKLAFEWIDRGDLVQYFPGEKTIEPKTAYTVQELLDIMITNSDNASYYVLLQHLRDLDPQGDIYLGTMRELGLIEPTANLDETLSARSYASIFRALYNASFLKPELSELGLSMLSKSVFWAGLRGGVPEEIQIAHKFGERSGLPGGQKELHDCGIVYYPGNPYLICVMLEGYEFMPLATVIRNVSDMMYDEVDSRRIL